jgi:hypothetical protein
MSKNTTLLKKREKGLATAFDEIIAEKKDEKKQKIE